MNDNDDGKFDIDDVDRRETHSICPDGRGKIRERAGRKTENNGNIGIRHTRTYRQRQTNE